MLKLDIQAERDLKSDNEDERLWTVNININFENIGSVFARLSILDKEISATLWSENETLNNLIDSNLPLLGKIVCMKGSPVEQENPLLANNLINISV
ncbi:MAG: flagellar hook-length control protein FliK [Proteobacteria bacterium]|nr:flagellar hook-length control protein FliK [Pseudomonadota bacterium]